MKDEHSRDQKISTGFAVLVVSDSRTIETDKSGKLAQELLVREGHSVERYDIVRNDETEIRQTVETYLRNSAIRVILTSGGTGVGRKDLTASVLESMFDKTLTGFGEHFRRLSIKEVGLAAVYSRSTAGLIGSTVVYCLPGSKNAMKTALKKVILPSIGHLIWEVDR
ncbi:MAG: MogA/MoaB family molybdenum cofactor biosynthesis protein [Candidatus Thorarchaeota archaeon]|nr:MAG: MogA/MoaB family molybdenum cofactor biosynthesis protein [Candidatus Thorarchaeota archaeon]